MQPDILIVDLFCGAGGTTTGFSEATVDGRSVAKVIACVNHDPIAITSHAANHPDVLHFTEDIRTLDLTELIAHANHWRAVYPSAKLVLWASLECTNFSKAKGGLPRDADSRTLAEHLYRYIDVLRPDAIKIENVEEFMSWGPLDEKGKPISKYSGCDYVAWVNGIKQRGYHYDYKLLNAADYGAHTSRIRYFGLFAGADYPMTFPAPTHAKNAGTASLFSSQLQPWKPVREVLDLDDEGADIFARKKPLCEKTLARIEAGLIKFVAGGKKQHENFLMKMNSGHPGGMCTSPEQPAGSLTTKCHQAVVSAQWIDKQFSSGTPTESIDAPAGAVLQVPKKNIVTAQWLDNQYGQSNATSIDQPCGTIPANPKQNVCEAVYMINYNHSSKCADIQHPSPCILTRDKLGIVHPQFIAKYHGNGHNMHSVENPCPTVATNDGLATVKCFVMNPSWGGHASSIEDPSVTIIARQDKSPLYLVQTESGEYGIAVYESDSAMTIRIKRLMAMYGIARINMRMLKVSELKRIQGFPDNYVLHGNQSDQKKFLGNAVIPIIPQRWAEAVSRKIQERKEIAA